MPRQGSQTGSSLPHDFEQQLLLKVPLCYIAPGKTVAAEAASAYQAGSCSVQRGVRAPIAARRCTQAAYCCAAGLWGAAAAFSSSISFTRASTSSSAGGQGRAGQQAVLSSVHESGTARQSPAFQSSGEYDPRAH